MKKRILFFTMIAILFSCDDQVSQTTPNPISGKWFMQNLSCFCENNNNYEDQYILWNFNTTNNTLDIVNYFSNDFNYLTTGQYNFELSEQTITIQNNDDHLFFDYAFENEKLILSDQPELDGPLIKFIKKTIDCNDNPLENLEWLATIKNDFETDSLNNHLIAQYTYNDETVFLIPDCHLCSDALFTIYNCEGEIVCRFGSIAGMNTCDNWFFDHATNKMILFEN